MLGTLNGALEVRGVQLDPEDIRAEAAGFHELQDGLPVLTRIDIHYSLRIPARARDKVDRALERHQSKCPTAATLAGSVEIRWEADVQEV